jgi:hypothetical protein
METHPAVRPFRIDVPEEELVDLRRRIAATRWPSKELVEDRSQGVQLATLKELARYWEIDYDWRKAEAKLNALPQFTTEIDGVEIHFIHVRSQHENALPLIMTHGWPGSVIEMLEAVGPLTDPTAYGSAEDAFHLVLPSLPGYGFSGKPTEVGWDPGRVAQAWAELMSRLGYTRYVAQGGDLGAYVVDVMGRQQAEGLLAIHMNFLVRGAGDGARPADTEEERAVLAAAAKSDATDRGYFLEMATRPQTIGYALAGYTRRPGGLDARPRHGQLLQDLPRLPRRAALGQPHARPHRRQHHAVLGDRHGGLGGPGVLGGRTSPGPYGRGRPGSAGGHGPGRLHHLPRREDRGPAQLGRAGLPDPQLLQRGRPGRPLRRMGRAGTLL